MARKTMWAFAGALLAFAHSASAAAYRLEVENLKTYASEVVSSGDVRIDYRSGEEPVLTTRLGLDDDEAAAIEEDDVINLTITLTNAKFGRNVREGDMDAVANGVTGCSGRVRDTDDGEEGQSTVTFEIEAADANCVCTTCGANFRFNFTFPPLEGLDNRKPVTVTVSTDSPGGSNWPDTSEDDVVVGGWECDNDFEASMSQATCTTLTDGNLLTYSTYGASSSDRMQAAFIGFESGLTLSGTSGGSSRINLEAGRRSFIPPLYQAYLGSVRLGVVSAGDCTTGANPGRTETVPADCYLEADGTPFSIGRGGDGEGDLVVKVSGDFRNGDKVYLDLSRNWGPGTGEELDMVNGSMEGTFSLLDVAGNPFAGAGDAAEMNREEGVTPTIAPLALLYLPNGRDALRPSGYRTSWAVEFDDSDVSGKSAQPASTAANTHNTQYTVVEDDQVAYAIPPGTTGDIGQVRVKCEVATQCTVYLECDHADGRTWFSQVADPIGGRSTLVLTSEDLRDALPMDDDDWTRGRMSCTVYSTREISLQVLTRSSTGVLVNNTYVDD